MDTTATLPPPAASATGPASRRRDGPAGEGFAAALKVAEAPAAPGAEASVAPGPGLLPVTTPPGVEATAPPIVPPAMVPAPPLPGSLPADAVPSETAAKPLPKSTPDAGPLPPAYPRDVKHTMPRVVPAMATVPLPSTMPSYLDPETEVTEEPESPVVASELAERPAPELIAVAPPSTLPAASPWLIVPPAISPGSPEGDGAAGTLAAPQVLPAAALPSRNAPAPIDLPDPTLSAEPGAVVIGQGAQVASHPRPGERSASVAIAAGPAVGGAAPPEAATPVAGDPRLMRRPAPSTVPDAPPLLHSVDPAPATAPAGTGTAVTRPQTDLSAGPAASAGSRVTSAPRDRPMKLAATVGQATAVEAKADAAPPAPPAEPPPERLAAGPAEHSVPVGPSSQSEASPPSASPSPATLRSSADAGNAAPAGPSLPPAAAPAEASIPTRPAVQPPPPPARQVAQIAIALSLGSGQAPRLTVALEPEALGRVEIRIERGVEGETATVRVLAERPETLALLQRDARELDRALGQAGVPIAEGALQFGLSSGDQNQGGRHPGAGSGGAGGLAGRGPALPAEFTTPIPLALSLLDIAV